MSGKFRPPEVIVFSPDGDVVNRMQIRDLTSVEDCLQKALEKYPNKPIEWSDYSDEAVSKASGYALLAVVNDKEESELLLKNLEDRCVVKQHSGKAFIKMVYRKDSAEAKKWGIVQAPALLFVDTSRDDGKQVVDRINGKSTPPKLREFLLRCVAKCEKAAAK